MSGCDCVRCQTEGCDDSELCGCCLNAEVERLTTAIQAVRGLHHDIWRGNSLPNDHGELWPVPTCDECREPYPCDTIRAIEGEL